MALYNLTPHEITLYDSKGANVLVRIPSHGELRLAARDGPAPPASLRIVTGDGVQVPVAPAQEFTGLNSNSPGYTLLQGKLEPGDQIIVSMVVGEFMSKLPEYKEIVILGSASSPAHGVRDAQGRIVGCKALEYYAPK